MKDEEKLNLLIIYGSVRPQRRGIRVAKYFVNKLKERGHKAVLVDPLEYKLPLLEKPLYHYEKGEKIPPILKELSKIISEADGYIIVSGEYNHSIPPALTNLMNHFFDEYFYKPSGIVCYSNSSFGGVRAAMQLRAFLAEIGTTSIPKILPIPKVSDAFDPSGKLLDKAYEKRVSYFLEQFEWYAKAMKVARLTGTPPVD